VPARQGPGIVPALLQTGQLLVPRLATLFVREPRTQGDVGQNLGQSIEISREPGHGHRHGVPARRHAKRGPDLVDAPGQLEGVALAGAPLHELGRELGEARPVALFAARAAPHGQAQHQPGQAAILEQQPVQTALLAAAVQTPRLHHRRLENGRRR